MAKVLIAIPVMLLVAAISYPFWFHLYPFYRTCIKVQAGMSSTEAEAIMSEYVNRPGYATNREHFLFGTGLYIAGEQTANQCNIAFKDGMVRLVEPVFD